MKTTILMVATAAAMMTASCNNGEAPATETITKPSTEATANKPSIGQDQVQGSWELFSMIGEGADFEMQKGIVLKFNMDVLKITQNANEKLGVFYIKNKEMYYNAPGMNVVWKVSIVDGNLQIINEINQTLTYKKIII
jgi:hypothetical protein